MSQYLVHGLNGLHCFRSNGHVAQDDVVSWLKAQIETVDGIPALHQVLHLSALDGDVETGLGTWIARLSIRIDGGKGGFGALLRGTGGNPQGPVNNDSSRDLDGRRIRDAQALAKIQRALDKKEAALNGTPLPDSDDEEELKKSKKRRNKRKTKEVEVEVELMEESEKEAKYAVKEAKAARIRQVHKEVVEETVDAVVAGFTASVEKKASSGKPKATTNLYGDIYAGVLSDEEDEEDEESEESESETEGPVSDAQSSSTTTLRDSKESSPIVNHNPTPMASSAPKQAAEDDLPAPDRASAKRSHTAMSEETLVDLMQYDNSVALEALGLDRLKQELAARGLMIGGNLTQRATRLFQVRGLSPEQYPPEVLAKTKKAKA